MPDLTFSIDNAEPQQDAAAPSLSFTLRISNSNETEEIKNVLLHSQIRIDATRRRYTPQEQAHLGDLFGEPSRWGETLRSMLWTHADVMVSSFQGSTVVDLSVPCTFDFNVAATKYFHGLEDGDIPLSVLFSGSIFYLDAAGSLQVSRIAWDKEAQYRLPVQVWRQMIDQFYPNTAWLCLRRDAFEQLDEYKRRRGLPTWEQALKELLSQEGVAREAVDNDQLLGEVLS